MVHAQLMVSAPSMVPDPLNNPVPLMSPVNTASVHLIPNTPPLPIREGQSNFKARPSHPVPVSRAMTGTRSNSFFEFFEPQESEESADLNYNVSVHSSLTDYDENWVREMGSGRPEDQYESMSPRLNNGVSSTAAPRSTRYIGDDPSMRTFNNTSPTASPQSTSESASIASPPVPQCTISKRFVVEERASCRKVEPSSSSIEQNRINELKLELLTGLRTSKFDNVNKFLLSKSDVQYDEVEREDLDSQMKLDPDDTTVDHNSFYEDIDLFRRISSPRLPDIYWDPYNRSDQAHIRLNRNRIPSNSKLFEIQQSRINRKTLLRGTILIVDDKYRFPGNIFYEIPAGDKEDELIGDKHVTGEMSSFKEVVLAHDKNGDAFLVPVDVLGKFGDPGSESWFYPTTITAQQASIFLSKENQEGCFLVYREYDGLIGDSSAKFVLSVARSNGDVLHYRIIENYRGDVMIEGHDRSFLTVKELVNYFQKNRSRLATRLRRPLREARLPLTPGLHYDIRNEIRRNNLTLNGRILGSNKFGVFCLGKYSRNGVETEVTVKVLQKVDGSVIEEDDFLNEMVVLKELKHPNIIKLVGVSFSERPLYIVVEHPTLGTLKECLKNGTIPTSTDQLMDVCMQAVAAMCHLERYRFILHRNISANSFQVTGKLVVKLGSLDRARITMDDEYRADRTEKIWIKWAAPEVMSSFIYSTKSDVWSLGVVLWEAFSAGSRPYNQLSTEQTAVYVFDGGRLERPEMCGHELYALMRQCWMEDPSERPSFEQIQGHLKGNMKILSIRNHLKTKRFVEIPVTTIQPDPRPQSPILPLVKLPITSKPSTPTRTFKFKRSTVSRTDSPSQNSLTPVKDTLAVPKSSKKYNRPKSLQSAASNSDYSSSESGSAISGRKKRLHDSFRAFLNSVTPK